MTRKKQLEMYFIIWEARGPHVAIKILNLERRTNINIHKASDTSLRRIKKVCEFPFFFSWDGVCGVDPRTKHYFTFHCFVVSRAEVLLCLNQ